MLAVCSKFQVDIPCKVTAFVKSALTEEECVKCIILCECSYR